MKKTQRYVSLLAIVFILLSSAATSYAASTSCPHPGYYISSEYQASGGNVGSHLVNGKTCYLYEIFDVYEYQCTTPGCTDRFTKSYYSYIYHSRCQ